MTIKLFTVEHNISTPQPVNTANANTCKEQVGRDGISINPEPDTYQQLYVTADKCYKAGMVDIIFQDLWFQRLEVRIPILLFTCNYCALIGKGN